MKTITIISCDSLETMKSSIWGQKLQLQQNRGRRWATVVICTVIACVHISYSNNNQTRYGTCHHIRLSIIADSFPLPKAQPLQSCTPPQTRPSPQLLQPTRETKHLHKFLRSRLGLQIQFSSRTRWFRSQSRNCPPELLHHDNIGEKEYERILKLFTRKGEVGCRSKTGFGGDVN